MELEAERIIGLFQRYLQINTSHPNPNYGPAIEFLVKLVEEIDLPHKILELVPKKPILIVTFPGSRPDLKSVMLNNHMDVVAAFPNEWKYDPFSAYLDADGFIHGRGSQDMKCLAIQQLEAIRQLKKSGKTMLRNVHLTFVPDEEIGGHDGMRRLVETSDFQTMNVGFALDEGVSSPSEIYSVFYAQRSTWAFRVICTGNSGHGSKFVKNTAADKMRQVFNKLLEFREIEEKKFETENLSVGNYITLNLTKLEGGVQTNVVPAEFKATFDLRLPASVNHEEFEQQLNKCLKECGPGIKLEFLNEYIKKPPTDLSDENPWWKAFKQGMEKKNLKFCADVFLGRNDTEFVKAKGIPTLDFSPLIRTPQLLHEKNECLHKDIFLSGISLYVDLIEELANVPE